MSRKLLSVTPSARCGVRLLTGRHIRAFVGLMIVVIIGGTEAADARWRLEFLSDLNVPTGTAYESVGSMRNSSTVRTQDRSRESILARKASGVFGGISAIAFDPKSSTLYALSDSSTPTMFPFKLTLAEHELQLEPTSIVRLGDKNGSPLPGWTVDPEGIALSPDGTLFISSEGYVARTPPVPPAIMEFDTDGHSIRQFDVPQKFLPADAGNPPRGVRVNKGFESMTLSPDATRLYTATEHPLEQDQAGCGLNKPCFVRVLEFAMNRDDPHAISEYVYELDPLTASAGFAATTGILGLPDLLSLGDAELLAIERGFTSDRERNGRNRIRIYHLNFEGATDVLRTNLAPSESSVQSVRKTLVLDLDDIVEQFDPAFGRLDNFEGICLGPTLEDGNRSIILVSDNNFSSRQRTAFLLFRLAQH